MVSFIKGVPSWCSFLLRRDTMEYIQYGLDQYGLYQYGRYELDGDDGYKVIDQPRMRIRIRDKDGGIGLWVASHKQAIAIPGHFPRMRIRTNTGEFVEAQWMKLPYHPSKVRIRAHKNDKAHDWVIYEEGIIKEG